MGQAAPETVELPHGEEVEAPGLRVGEHPIQRGARGLGAGDSLIDVLGRDDPPALGGDLSKTTHAEQSFSYHAMAYANDALVLRRRIVDVYTKKGGSLEFVVKQTDVMRGDERLAEILFTIALRHPEVTA